MDSALSEVSKIEAIDYEDMGKLLDTDAVSALPRTRAGIPTIRIGRHGAEPGHLLPAIIDC